MDDDFKSLFYPESVAVFGAKKDRIEYTLSFKETKFPPDKVFLLSDTETEVFGFKCWKSIFDFSDPIDLAIICLRPEYVLQAIEDCKEKGVKFVHIFTAGFGEKDAEGKELENKIIKSTEKNKSPRILGPNCMGVYCPDGKIAFGPTFPKESGPVAFISQSGALAIRFVFDGIYRGFKFSKMISLGNSIDLTILDFIEYLDQDPDSKIICIYIEGLTDGQKLIKSLKNTTKPVIILKGGVSQVGKRAVQSHTGSIAGKTEIWNSIFKQTPSIPVDSLDEMADLVLAFTYSPFLPQSNRIAIISFSGGVCVEQADVCTKLGLEIPQFTKKIREEMKKYFPAWIDPQNPLDIPTMFRKPRILDIFRGLGMTGDLIEAVIIDTPARIADPYWEKVVGRNPKMVIENLAKGGEILREHKKLFFLSIPPSYFYKEREFLKDFFLSRGFPVFFSISDAAKAVLKMSQYYKKSKKR